MKLVNMLLKSSEKDLKIKTEKTVEDEPKVWLLWGPPMFQGADWQDAAAVQWGGALGYGMSAMLNIHAWLKMNEIFFKEEFV